MDTDSPALENLSPDECMRLMGSVAVGRIVYSRRALPAVELVNFALVDGDIVIRTSAEGKLAAATRGAVVAFEADAVELDGHAGWSVAVVGQARAVSDAEEIGRLERVALTSWVPGCGGHFIRISPAIVNGRRVFAQRLAPSALAPRDRRRLSRSISGCAGHVFALHATERTEVITQERHLDDVNLCIEEVLSGQGAAAWSSPSDRRS
jgi:uncharacterized protein